MSLEPSARRIPSPAFSSGRASPVYRLPRHAPEDGSVPKDKAFRRYASGVERALSSFDTAQQEWADYISFLGRLLKALQGRPPDSHIVPDSQVVATRLAQCLNPSLPSGVHQKALEVYTYVFATIGRENLARDFHLYFPGLSPVLSFASLSVRPYFLTLLENYILPLEATSLRPALKAIILCLLPGLEDETSEDFERILQVVDKFRQASATSHADPELDEPTDAYFWQCLFLATITNSSRRQGALAYLVRYLPKFADQQVARATEAVSVNEATIKALPASARAVITPEPGLLIRCLGAGLNDNQLLVQRGFLDLLVSNIPLGCAVMQFAASKADLERLIFAAVGVVYRRDMSLNRRLWAWLLGPEPKSEADGLESGQKSPGADAATVQSRYFAKNGLEPLSRSLLAMIKRPTTVAADRARPFRICLSLMDRWEVGGLITPVIFIPAMSSAFTFSKSAGKMESEEVIKSVSVFFDGVESSLIWEKFLELLELALEPGPLRPLPLAERLRNLELCCFMIQRFNLREEEMILHHIPLVSLTLILRLNRQRSPRASSNALFEQLKPPALDILEKLANLIPERAFVETHKATSGSRVSFITDATGHDEIIRLIDQHYCDQGAGIESSPPLAPIQLGTLLFRQTLVFFIQSVSSRNSQTLETCARVLAGLLQTIPDVSQALQSVDVLSAFQNAVEQEAESATDPSGFVVLSAITSVLVGLQSSSQKQYLKLEDVLSLQSALIAKLWDYLSPLQPKYHVEAVRCIWQLEAIPSLPRCVEASISSLIISSPSISPADTGRRFAVLWTHSIQDRSLQADKVQKGSRKASGASLMPSAIGDPSAVLSRPLLLLLDSLREEGTELHAFVKTWVQELPGLGKVLDIVIENLASLKCIQNAARPSAKGDNGMTSELPRIDDTQECLYYMRHLHNLLKYASEHTWLTLSGEPVAPLGQEGNNDADPVTLQTFLAQLGMRGLDVTAEGLDASHIIELHLVSLATILLVIHNPYSAALKDMDLDELLLDRLHADLGTMGGLLQTQLLETITAALKLRFHGSLSQKPHQRKFSRDLNPISPRILGSKEKLELPPPPKAALSGKLVDCLKAGFTSPSSRVILDSWVALLIEALPLFADTIFQNLIPLVECFCSQIKLVLEELKATFLYPQPQKPTSPEPTMISLLNGLEHILARAHDHLTTEEVRSSNPKGPDQPQGFFGNMVQGVFATESQQPVRSATANNRLAVLLCFQDTVRTCFAVWSWGVYGQGSDKQDSSSAASFGYTSLRMRNRARRLLEHLFAAEALECLETLAALWCRAPSSEFQPESVMGLLNVLNGSRPKHTLPAVFNAVYSRTNPSALDPARMSSLTSELSDVDLVTFLVSYMDSIEDDAMDEIWTDCIAFLKDILANPLPHSQILPMLLEFVALVAQKVDNTNFGEQRRMRRELADLFLRLLTAAFTTRPMGFLQEPAQAKSGGKVRHTTNGQSRVSDGPRDFISILATVVPKFQLILVDNERVSTAISNISTNVIAPTIRAKAFPSNMDASFLNLLFQLTKFSQGSKFWRKDVSDALNDTKFFTMSHQLLLKHWMPILQQFTINDKERMPELLGRLAAPTTAGIVFGVGATSARMEADRKMQLNLRRIALLILSSAPDTFVPNIGTLEEKLVELFTATPTTSPSSATRADAYMVLRALVLRTSSVHLAPLWPLMNTELQTAIVSVLPESPEAEKFNAASVLQAAKLLDALVMLDPDDFQLHEWLFVPDTIDAVYRPPDWMPTALVDEVAEALGNAGGAVATPVALQSTQAAEEGRRPLLDGLIEGLVGQGVDVRALPKEELATRVLRPFFGQLGILAFEATYGGAVADGAAFVEGLLRDLREDGETP